MAKHYAVMSNGDYTQYETYEQAEDKAKRYVSAKPAYSYFILETIAQVKSPTPAAEVTKL